MFQQQQEKKHSYCCVCYITTQAGYTITKRPVFLDQLACGPCSKFIYDQTFQRQKPNICGISCPNSPVDVLKDICRRYSKNREGFTEKLQKCCRLRLCQAIGCDPTKFSMP